MAAGGRASTSPAHRSRILDAQMVDDADLVIGMERFHAREVMVLDPAAMGRTFTLKELVRRAIAIGPRDAGEPLDDWLQRPRATAARPTCSVSRPDDDVADPYRRSADVYERCAAEIDHPGDHAGSAGVATAAEGAA